MVKSLKTFLLSFIISTLLLISFLVLRALRLIPFMDFYITNAFSHLTGLTVSKESYSSSLFTWEMYKALHQCLLLDRLKPVVLGFKAPNPKLLSLDGASGRCLLDFAGCRPLVVNFGSCSWPKFRLELQKFNEIVNSFVEFADFMVVYIEEAHPVDGWMFKVSSSIIHSYAGFLLLKETSLAFHFFRVYVIKFVFQFFLTSILWSWHYIISRKEKNFLRKQTKAVLLYIKPHNYH